MTARIGVVTFPGSLDDRDALRAVGAAGGEPVALWHGDHDLKRVDAVVLPGGFSYGDYLRCGAIARFTPVMTEVIQAANAGMPVLGICNGFQVLCESHLLPGALLRNAGMPVLGICNGFQVLCESHLLPGALLRNAGLHFTCLDQRLRVESTSTPWTAEYTDGSEIVIPVKNGAGQYVADDRTLDELEGDGRVVFRYVGANPNGSRRDIAGIRNEAGNVVGLMPHPEHAIDALTGPGTDGLGMFVSVLKTLVTQ